MSVTRRIPKILVVLALLFGLTIVAGSPASAVPQDSGSRLFPVPAQHSSIDTMVVFGPGIVFSDPVAHVVRYLSPEEADFSGQEGVLVGNGSSGLPVAGPATSSPMISPTGLAFDEQNSILYIADTGANMVVAVTGLLSPGTPQLSIVAGTGVAGSPDFSLGGAAGPVSKLNGPRAVAVSDDGELAIADTGNNSVYRVQKFGTTDVLFPLVGPGAPACFDGVATVPPTASGPRGLFWDGDGNLLVADTGNHRVMSGTFVGEGCLYGRLAGTGVAGAVTEGPARESKLSAPVSILFDFSGYLSIADAGNHQLLGIDPAGDLFVAGGTGSADPIDFNSTSDPITESLGSISQVGLGGYFFFLVDSTNNIFAFLGQATAPTKPTPLGATPGNGSASVSFTAPTDNGGRAITKYQFTTNDGSTWTDAVGTTSPVTISGLTNETNYSIKLRAVNSIGEGEMSSVAVSVTPTSPANAGPTVCPATAMGKTRIQACWNPLSPARGSVTKYRAVVFIEGTSTKVASCTGTAADVSCLVNGKDKLAANTTYDVRVRARIRTAPGQVFWTQYSGAVKVTTTP